MTVRRAGEFRRVEFRPIEALPRLAWCARLTRNDPTVVVEHGPWVETFPGGFVEGAWNGSFAGRDFAGADVFLGSGGRLAGDRLAFTTTTHTMERLQSVRVGDALFVSNSFTYLLAAAHDRLDTSYRLYERDFQTFLNGYHRARRAIRTASGRTVRLHYNETVLVDQALSVSIAKPPLPPAFRTFAQYVECVASTMQALHANATASERTVTYSPLTTISSGYDSPACTVLAQVIGCTQAVTFPEARTEHNPSRLSDSNDSGAEIGRYLGVDVTSFVREEYLGRQDFPEAEFLATGNGGDDVVMSALERVLPRTMLITGFLGDTLWGIGGQDPRESRYYRYGFPAGASLAEFRLRLGFIHAPVPLFTFPRHPEVDSITRSHEMEPWRVGGPYDRPIPRRLSSRAESRARCLGKRTRLLHSPSGLHRRSRAFSQNTPTTTWWPLIARLRCRGEHDLQRGSARCASGSYIEWEGRDFTCSISGWAKCSPGFCG